MRGVLANLPEPKGVGRRGQAFAVNGFLSDFNELPKLGKVAPQRVVLYGGDQYFSEGESMSLRERLQAAVKEAMKAKQAERLSTLRLMGGAIKDREIAGRSEAGVVEVTEADIMAVFGKMVKQRQESAKVYETGGRPELAEKELAEVRVIEEFLPAQLTATEVEAAIGAAVAEAGATSIKDMGKVMGVLKAKYTGQMDFGAVGALIKARLA